MKLLLLLNAIDGSGPIKGAYALYKEILRLREEGVHCDVKVVSVSSPPARVPEGFDPALVAGVVYLGCDGWRMLPAGIWRYIRLLRRERPDAVLSFGFRSNILNCIRWRGARRLAALRATTLREPMEFDYATSWLRRWFGIYAGYTVMGMKEVVVYLFDEMIENDRRNYWIRPGRFVAIANFLDEEATEGLAARTADLPTGLLSREPGTFQFIALSHLNNKKNLHELIAAFAAALREQHALRLTIVGDGDERGRLEALARELEVADKVRFAGYLRNPLPLLARMDCMVLSSLTDATPRAALEAIHLGVPVIIPDLTGLHHLVTEANGIVYQRGELRTALLRMAANRPQYRPALPPSFRQSYATRRYLELVESA